MLGVSPVVRFAHRAAVRLGGRLQGGVGLDVSESIVVKRRTARSSAIGDPHRARDRTSVNLDSRGYRDLP